LSYTGATAGVYLLLICPGLLLLQGRLSNKDLDHREEMVKLFPENKDALGYSLVALGVTLGLTSVIMNTVALV
jgi:hypothetical protein